MENIFNIVEPDEPGEYWMEDEDGGPTLYVCELIDGELRCGPKSTKHRWPLEMTRTASTKWTKVTPEQPPS